MAAFTEIIKNELKTLSEITSVTGYKNKAFKLIKKTLNENVYFKQCPLTSAVLAQAAMYGGPSQELTLEQVEKFVSQVWPYWPTKSSTLWVVKPPIDAALYVTLSTTAANGLPKVQKVLLDGIKSQTYPPAPVLFKYQNLLGYVNHDRVTLIPLTTLNDDSDEVFISVLNTLLGAANVKALRVSVCDPAKNGFESLQVVSKKKKQSTGNIDKALKILYECTKLDDTTRLIGLLNQLTKVSAQLPYAKRQIIINLANDISDGLLELAFVQLTKKQLEVIGQWLAGENLENKQKLSLDKLTQPQLRVLCHILSSSGPASSSSFWNLVDPKTTCVKTLLKNHLSPEKINHRAVTNALTSLVKAPLPVFLSKEFKTETTELGEFVIYVDTALADRLKIVKYKTLLMPVVKAIKGERPKKQPKKTKKPEVLASTPAVSVISAARPEPPTLQFDHSDDEDEDVSTAPPVSLEAFSEPPLVPLPPLSPSLNNPQISSLSTDDQKWLAALDDIEIDITNPYNFFATL
ncbi:protein ORF84 [Lake sturgeon herpesvirus]|nr:protein ORF84 [Lake sturgeon herpesvirus]